MLTANTYLPVGIASYALESAAAQADVSKAEALSITADTTLKLPAGETLTYSTITIASGKR